MSEIFYAYRIADRRHPIFDGTGAMLNGGRWNSPGNMLIYASLSFSCAMLEILVQGGRGGMPKNHQYVKIETPRSLKGEQFDFNTLGKKRKALDLLDCRTFGDLWYKEKRSAYLIVPSMVALEDHNIIFNIHHPDFQRVKASSPLDIDWDERLFR